MSDSINEIDRQAAEWAVKMDADGPAPDAKAEFDAWLAADLRHMGAYLRARVVMEEVSHHKPELRLRFCMRRSYGTGTVRRTAIFGGMAAALAATIAMVVLGSDNSLSSSYTTAIGERQRIALSDGSSVTLNTKTTLVARYSRDRRDVTLDEGEAIFNVAHDTRRPFVVFSRGVEIRAVGTRFSVLSLPGASLEVRVVEGVVRIKRGGTAEPVDIRSNMHASVDPQNRIAITSETPQEIEQDLAWRDGYIVLRHRTLISAANEFSRYNRTAIRIADASIAQLVITGSYASDDPAGFAKTVALTFDLDVAMADGEVRLMRKRH